jgi:hypothetical protein
MLTTKAVAIGLLFSAACGGVRRSTATDGGNDSGSNVDGSTTDATTLAPGKLIWARSMGAASAYRVQAGPGGLVIGGSFNAPTDLGNGVILPIGSYDALVAGFSPVNADLYYATHFGDVGYEAAFVDSLDSGGAPIVHGITEGATNIGNGVVAAGGGSDTFIGRYGTSGVPAWSKRVATAAEDKIISTSPGPAGTVYATGFFVGTSDLDGTPHIGNGTRDAMLYRINTATGAVDFGYVGTGSARDEGSDIAWHGTSTFWAGQFEGILPMPTGAVPNKVLASAGGLDLFVVKFNDVGSVVWSNRFGGTGNDYGPRMGTDANGDVYISGTFQNQIAFGAINLTSAGSDDIYLAKLNGMTGDVVWATSIGSPGSDNILDLAVDKNGRVVISGNAGGALNIGGSNAGGLDAFVACFQDAGQVRWKSFFSTAADDRGWGVAITDDAVYATVTVAGPIDLGLPLIGSPNPQGLLLKFAP